MLLCVGLSIHCTVQFVLYYCIVCYTSLYIVYTSIQVYICSKCLNRLNQNLAILSAAVLLCVWGCCGSKVMQGWSSHCSGDNWDYGLVQGLTYWNTNANTNKKTKANTNINTNTEEKILMLNFFFLIVITITMWWHHIFIHILQGHWADYWK